MAEAGLPNQAFHVAALKLLRTEQSGEKTPPTFAAWMG